MPDIFSTEIPGLLKEHYAHLAGSAISVEVIRERGYRSVLGKTALKDAGFSPAQQRSPGILIPLHGAGGNQVGWQYRPDSPRRGARERVIKYENPAGTSIHLDVPPRCRQYLGDPTVPLWITEGVKKVDALAAAGACAIGLTGVWGWKGKNQFGGTTILSDFDHIALKGRLMYPLFDSDSSRNPHVYQALVRMVAFLEGRGGRVMVLQLPAGPEGAKVGADDYLAQGHTLEDLTALAASPERLEKPPAKLSPQYIVEDGRVCWLKNSPDGPTEVPLCNFTAKVTRDILRDNGLERNRYFRIEGQLGSGETLEPIESTSANFNSLNWVTGEWGMRAVIAAGTSSKDRLREAIQLMSQDVQPRTIFTHTGWRDIGGEMHFLSGSGVAGRPDLEVELDPPLQRYQLPDPDKEDPAPAIQKSLDFLYITPDRPEVTYPLWAAMYLAPLAELVDPAFTIWLVGPSGAFKSTLTALALCHFGAFDSRHLPASWRDTGNQLEKLMFLCKDLPLVIDDWAPGQDSAKARELEVKAEYVVRAQGNRQGRGRMRADTSSRPVYIPRGLLVTSGEQLPGGHSHTARIFSVELEREDIDKELLSQGQADQYWSCVAMSHYIAWLKRNWAHLKETLPRQWRQHRDRAQETQAHPRMPEAIAGLYCAMELATDFALGYKAITDSELQSYRSTAWDIFCQLAAAQASRVEEERPGKRFMEVLRAMHSQGKAVLCDKEDDAPRVPVPGTVAIGWLDRCNGASSILLNPRAAYGAVYEYCQHAGQPFTFKEEAVWKDLKRMGISECQEGRNKGQSYIYGRHVQVISMKFRHLGIIDD